MTLLVLFLLCLNSYSAVRLFDSRRTDSFIAFFTLLPILVKIESRRCLFYGGSKSDLEGSYLCVTSLLSLTRISSILSTISCS